MKRTCENCAAWHQTATQMATATGDIGNCRRYAPRANVDTPEWARTYAEDWCLEWVPRLPE
jgi:hypothetical protein